MQLLGPLKTALGVGHVVLVGLLLAPVVGSGAARTAAVVGDSRGAVDVSGEQEHGSLEDVFRLRPQRILRNNRILLEVIVHRFGNLDGVFPVPDGDRLPDLGRGNRLDGLLLFRFRLRILFRLGCDRQGRLGLADRLPLELLLRVQFLPGILDPGRGEVPVLAEDGGLEPGVAPQEGVAGNLVVAVAPVFDAVAVSLKVGLIRLPAEGFHIFQRGLAVE